MSGRKRSDLIWVLWILILLATLWLPLSVSRDLLTILCIILAGYWVRVWWTAR